MLLRTRGPRRTHPSMITTPQSRTSILTQESLALTIRIRRTRSVHTVSHTGQPSRSVGDKPSAISLVISDALKRGGTGGISNRPYISPRSELCAKSGLLLGCAVVWSELAGKSPHTSPAEPIPAPQGILAPLRQAGRLFGSFDGYRCQLRGRGGVPPRMPAASDAACLGVK